MSKSTLAGQESTGPDLAESTTNERTIVVDVVTEHLELIDSWDAWRTVAECSGDTIYRLNPEGGR